MNFPNNDNQADVIEAFNLTSRYLDDLIDIDNPYFEGMVNLIYPLIYPKPLFRVTYFYCKWICFF